MKFKILPIAGDASFRTFYRLVSNKSSKIIVSVKKEKYKNLIAYSAINKFLIRNKILAPNLYTHNFSKGIIVIEDFGDLSFYKILIKKKNKLIIYKKLLNYEEHHYLIDNNLDIIASCFQVLYVWNLHQENQDLNK